MILKNANVNGKLVNITLENGKITEIWTGESKDGTDLCGKTVIPGLIDVHTHGLKGIDTMDADFEKLCRFHALNGTTSWLPTTMTMGYDDLLKVCNAKTEYKGAQILGFHFEGPYISKKYKGAQNEKYIKNPSIEDFKQFKNVKMITIAPELEGAEEFIRAVTPQTVVSIGHTDCDYETALKAIEAGANCLTHTYNAMPPLNHRKPGPIGAGFEKNIYAQVIGDGFHILKPVVLATYKMFGPDRMVLISDSIRPACLPEGIYESGGLQVKVENNIIALLDGTIAGSSACMWDCVKNCISFGIPFSDAVKMATSTPAEMLGVNKGKIQIGYDADMLVIDDDLNIETVIIAGEVFD